ncbi:MAG: patatin-like phospholipase family protein [Gammaproteobacteria bacterium]|nr:patatin-like phospholipase family protein [Gammaproteobacteria bacterium]MCP5426137.1 patatin-like phospholipase family protein [Gammaproteobacteria bacterium]
MARTVSLVLGSGGARGYAHIGVIEALEETGYEIRAISGSSMGALIGGLYANGALAQYREWVLSLDFLGVMRLVDFTLSEAGIIKGDRVFEHLAYLLGDTVIEELPIAYTAIATDLTAGREVWFRRGSLKQAIRASIAIPMVFTPVIQDGRILVDGGVLNPLPVAPAVLQSADLVVAVNVNATQGQGYLISSAPDESDAPNEVRTGIARVLASMGWTPHRRTGVPDMGIFELMNRSFETMQRALSNYKMAGNPPDLMIEIPVEACKFYDFHKAGEMIERGHAATIRALENLEKQR